LKSLAWNKKENSIRGSFVNLMITVVILLLIVIGAFCDEVADRMANMAALIIGFFTSTMGIWAFRKSRERNHGQD
jgi:TRAP-type C4-dicarboxylate transport system permease large subunit